MTRKGSEQIDPNLKNLEFFDLKTMQNSGEWLVGNSFPLNPAAHQMLENPNPNSLKAKNGRSKFVAVLKLEISLNLILLDPTNGV